MLRTTRTRREIVEMVLVSLGFALGMALIVWGVSGAVTGREAAGIPDEIERVAPEPGDKQVLSRSEIFVDLAPGYTGELIVDGQALETVNPFGPPSPDSTDFAVPAPGTEVVLPAAVIFDPGNYSLRYQPQDGGPIEEWELGVHTVTVRFWDLEQGEGSARLFSWSFEVL